VRQQLKVRRELALSALETHLKDVATWNMPKGGFFVWIKILPSISMKLLYTKALSKGILLNIGSIYAQEKGNYVRLS
ncbi:GntR family transcriptional regulator, partial [Pseudomonas sp. GW456-E7]